MGWMEDLQAAVYGGLKDFNQGADRVLTGALGPAAQPTAALTRMAGEFLPGGADMRDITQGAQEVGRGNVLPGLTQTLGGYVGLGAPGSFSGYEDLLQSMVIAFHGSPHKFDKFSMDKIGTGEGAQAYGHGLYFAGSPNVAEQYRSALAARPTVNGVPVADNHPLKIAGGDIDEAIKIARESRDFFKKQTEENPMLQGRSLQKAEDELDELLRAKETGNFTADIGGASYKVALNVEEEDLLDYDLPLSQQPKKVREALEPMISDFKRTAVRGSPRLSPNATADEIAKIEKEAAEQVEGMEAATLLQVMDRRLGRADVARRLRDSGVQGLRYKDAGSRGLPEGDPKLTRNYVMFDDALIDILERNGEPLK